MARFHSFILLLATVAPCLGLSTGCRAKSPTSNPVSTTAFTADFDSFVETVLKELKVPGISVALINGNQTFAKGYGYATLPDKKAAADTLWFGASTTKAFVGATLSHLIQNKTYPDLVKDGWSTPISSIIPDDFVLADDWATKHITLDDAICHRTGLPRHDYAWQYTGANGSLTPVRDVVRTLRHLPLVNEPRVAHEYNNLMYMVLSHVVETLTKKPLKTVFKELFWGPLKMTSTFLDVSEAKAAAADRLATGYHWDSKTQRFGAITRDTLQASGAAGIITSVEDHARWIQSLVHQTGPLSKDAHADVRRPRTISNKKAWPEGGLDMRLYGLGWTRTLFHGEELFFHAGESLSFGTTIWWMPGRQFGAVVMGNVYKHANFAGQAIIRRLADDALGVAPEKRFDSVKDGKEELEKLDGEFAKAPAELYPKSNETARAPPPAGLSALAGTYEDPGYGRLVFKVAGNATSPTLIAERPDMLYQYNVRLQHVSSNDWVAFFESALGSRLPAQYFEAHFNMAGNVSTALEMKLWGETKRYNVTFNKVA